MRTHTSESLKKKNPGRGGGGEVLGVNPSITNGQQSQSNLKRAKDTNRHFSQEPARSRHTESALPVPTRKGKSVM